LKERLTVCTQVGFLNQIADPFAAELPADAATTIQLLKNENQNIVLERRFVFSYRIKLKRRHLILLFFNSLLYAFHRRVCAHQGT
jgi:hypothetical protein